ncbi:MAG: S-layer homology domain-containing protein [Thermoleophilia bacterium]|nr:S-layer homology domain-containing protein [Thermoleophilia bacterium]
MTNSRFALFAAALLSVVLLVPACLPAHAGLAAVWAVDDGEKVFQDDLSHPLKAGGGDNSVWDGSTVSLFSAANEIVAFQLILEADAAGANSVNVTVSSLTGGSTVIRGSHPLLAPNDYLGLGVELFTEHYFDISTPSWDSDCGGLGWSGDAKPNITGKIPDALVPFAAKQGKGGAPFDVGASLNQGVWVDIYVPRTATAGVYTGTITVTVGGVTEVEIPLELEVLDFALPDETHYKTMVFYSKDTLIERHTTGWCTPEMWEMMRAYNRMAHRHRLELIGCGTWDEANYLTGVLTGDAFTAAGNYDGPGVGIGNSLFSIATYGGWWSQDQNYYETQSDAWVNWFNDNGLGDLDYFLYLTDEPGPSLYPDVQQRAAWIHDNPGPGHDLPVFLTRWPISDLAGAIDIWCTPPQLYDPSDAAEAQARDESVWLYASYRPQTPADATDEYGIAWRLKAWVGHYRDIPRWFTWESTHYYHNSNEVDPGGRRNVWANPIGFSRKWYDDGDVEVPCPQDTGNGDGILFYPGQDAVFPEEDREYAGPVSSIRMKMYRRGIQDVEYMWLAEQSGQAAQANTIVGTMLPNTMWDADIVPTWSNQNADYEAARRELADLIEGHTSFSDVGPDHWAYSQIMACVAADIVAGYPDGFYRPAKDVTRDQMAVYISRALAGNDAAVPTGPAEATFPDVPGDHWAYDYVEYAAANNIVEGYADGTYQPGWTVNRGQMAVFVARAMVDPTGEAGLETYEPPTEASFPDIPVSFWCFDHVEYLHEHSVVGGYPDGNYRPTATVTRDQMAVYIQRAFELPLSD